MNVTVHPFERVDDLHRKGYRLIQNPEAFCFGVDAVFLSHFAHARPGQKVLDLCTGNGVVPILMASRREGLDLTGVEIQSESVDLARRSAALNDLQIRFLEGDIRDLQRLLPAGTFDVVTANPPYMNAGGGLLNEAGPKAIARHELMCTLQDVVSAAAKMLRFGGKFYLIHRPQRLTDILTCLREKKLEPKTLRFIHPYVEKPPVLVMVEAARGGNPMLRVMPPLVIYGSDGRYTKEVEDIYYHE